MRKGGVIIGLIFLILSSVISSSYCAEAKGKKTTKPSEKPLPDLVIERVWLDAQCQINFQIKNVGKGGIPDSEYRQGMVKVYFGKEHEDIYFTKTSSKGKPPMDPGGKLKSPGGMVQYDTQIKLEESLSVCVVVDEAKKINESSNANNRLAQSLTPQCLPLVQKVAPPGAPGKPVSRIEGFLKEIEKADTLETLGRALKAANFSQEELKELAGEIKRPPYSSKLNALVKKAEAESIARAEGKAQQRRQRKQGEQQQKQEQELNRLNMEAQAKLQTLKAKAIQRAKTPSSLKPLPLATGTHIPLPEDLARIREVIPQPAIVGQDLHIRGENFGRRGSVTVTVEGVTETARVLSWHEEFILIRIPPELRGAVGETEKEARLWVDAEKNKSTTLFRLRPNTSWFVPSIASLSSSDIRPGQILIIEGRNFLTEHTGTVEFRFAGRTFSGIIDEWNDTYIQVRLASDITGMSRREGTVKVRNHLGNETTNPIIFEPRKELLTLPTVHTSSIPPYTYVLHLISQSTQYTDNDFNLINGWTVSDFWIGDEEFIRLDLGTDMSCRYIQSPQLRSANARSRWQITIELTPGLIRTGAVETRATCTNYLVIEGPAGVPYR